MPKTDKNPQPTIITNPLKLIRDKEMTWAKDPKNPSLDEVHQFFWIAEHSLIARGFDPNQVVKMGIAIRMMFGDSK